MPSIIPESLETPKQVEFILFRRRGRDWREGRGNCRRRAITDGNRWRWWGVGRSDWHLHSLWIYEIIYEICKTKCDYPYLPGPPSPSCLLLILHCICHSALKYSYGPLKNECICQKAQKLRERERGKVSPWILSHHESGWRLQVRPLLGETWMTWQFTLAAAHDPVACAWNVIVCKKKGEGGLFLIKPASKGIKYGDL